MKRYGLKWKYDQNVGTKSAFTYKINKGNQTNERMSKKILEKSNKEPFT